MSGGGVRELLTPSSGDAPKRGEPSLEPVVFERPGGGRCPGYVAEPVGARARGSVVLIHEMWGVSQPMRTLLRRFAEAGYCTLLPDLFRGLFATELEQGFALMRSLDFRDAAAEDVRGAARFVGRREEPVVAVGLCMGGAVSILAAEVAPELSAAVSFYGVPTSELCDPARIYVPLLGHFADRDDWCTPAKVDALEASLRAGGARFELHRYAAGHAFMNPESPSYAPELAELAWQRTLDFLARELS